MKCKMNRISRIINWRTRQNACLIIIWYPLLLQSSSVLMSISVFYFFFFFFDRRREKQMHWEKEGYTCIILGKTTKKQTLSKEHERKLPKRKHINVAKKPDKSSLTKEIFAFGMHPIQVNKDQVIESFNMKCRVLKNDPLTFFPNCPKLSQYFLYLSPNIERSTAKALEFSNN